MLTLFQYIVSKNYLSVFYSYATPLGFTPRTLTPPLLPYDVTPLAPILNFVTIISMTSF